MKSTGGWWVGRWTEEMVDKKEDAAHGRMKAYVEVTVVG